MMFRRCRSTLMLLMAAVFVMGSIAACGNKNQAERYVAKTDEEKADQAMKDGDFDEAIRLLEGILANEASLKDSDPNHYYSHVPLLAAAYARKSGFDLFGIMNAGSGGAATTGLMSSMDTFLPARASYTMVAYSALVADMKNASDLLAGIPDDLRDPKGAAAYAGSATLQLTLYSAAYAVMIVKQFMVFVDGTTTLDPSVLASMTDADARAFLGALVQAAGAAAVASGSAVSPDQLNAVLDAVDASPGATTSEKLTAYLQTH